jgi:hypothetical protein
MFNKIYKKFLNDDFSILSKMGDLSKYNFEQMNNLLKNWNKKIELSEECVYVTWENNSSLIKLKFDEKSGTLIKILAEEWKHFDLKFERF